MDGSVKLNVSVVSRRGTDCHENEDNFYVNGRFKNEYETDNVQVTLESSGDEYIFAVCDNMDVDIPDRSVSISTVKELSKFHNKIKSSGKDIDVKYDQLCELVEEVNNLIYSVGLGEQQENDKKSSFAGMIISGNKAAALNIANCRVYMLRGGQIKLLTSDYKKAERLLKMGIISAEQAELLSNQFGIPTDENVVEVKKSQTIEMLEDDVFLICSNGLTDMLSEEEIHEILLSSEDSHSISSTLIEEAVKNSGEKNATAMVIRIEELKDQPEMGVHGKNHLNRHSRSYMTQRNSNGTFKISKKKINEIKRYASILVVCILVVIIVYGSFKLWSLVGKKGQLEDILETDNTQQQTTIASEDTETEEQQPEDTSETGEQDNNDNVIEEPEPVYYEVKSGDSLYLISRKFYNDDSKYKLIMSANNITDENKIYIGQKLLIPEEE